MSKEQPLLSKKIINNTLVYLNRVPLTGIDEAYALIEIDQTLKSMLNEQQIIQTSPTIEPKQ